MRITTKGQVTIPIDIRERLGLLPQTEVEFQVADGCVQICKVEGTDRRGRALVEHMRGRATAGLTTEEILALTRGEDR